MNFLKMNLEGDPNLGLYGFATDKYCLLGFANKKIRQTLSVPVHYCKLLNMDFTGLFVAGNSSGIIINDVIEEYELKNLERFFEKILVLKTKYTALGNLVLMNDNGIIISPLLRKHKKEIEEFFGLPCEASTIAKQKIVGTLGLATNKGCLVNPKIKKKEMEAIQRVLKVNADIGTVGYGSMHPGAGIIANSRGFVVSEATSGPELGRITEALGFL